MKTDKGHEPDKKGGANYEDAMKEALSEIFQNLKVIEQDRTKKQREKVDLQRRVSAPALSTTLRETKAAFKQPKKELDRTMSAPTPSTSPAPARSVLPMQWVLQCFEED